MNGGQCLASCPLPSAALDSGLLENGFPSHVSPLLQHEGSQEVSSGVIYALWPEPPIKSSRGRGFWLSIRHVLVGKRSSTGLFFSFFFFLPNLRGVEQPAPTERSVQLVHLVLQRDRRSSCFAHPFGHDVPLGRQGFGFSACRRATEAQRTQNTAPRQIHRENLHFINVLHPGPSSK